LAGHSKWAQIKRKKAVNDQQRGKIISKHIRAIQSAVREGGTAEISANIMLKNALAAAKTDNVPQDNINRAIERDVSPYTVRDIAETRFFLN
jgi:transcriptional/translational regulatory protein YebC/TACO1